MLKMLSVLSQIRLSPSGICSVIAFFPWQPLRLCALYFQTDKERRDPPALLTQGTSGRKVTCDSGCVASQPVLSHLPLVVFPCGAREQKVMERGKINGLSLRDSHVQSL